MIGFVMGVVGVAVLQGIVSRPAATKNIGGVLAKTASAVKWFVSAEVPAFKTDGTTTSSSTGSTAVNLATKSTTTSSAPALDPYPGLAAAAGSDHQYA
ncbi:MAG TPA: hypothetical protein VHW47_10230 [Acidimicrobiales bacterium]|nr:hypothetical protein [Acidimicrobiales bacterium]